MPDKNPPAFPSGDFLCGKPHVAGTLVKANTLDRAGDGQTSAPDSTFPYPPWFSCQFFCEEHMRANTPVKTNTPNGAGGGQTSAPDSAFPYRPWFSCQFFCEEHMLAATPAKGKHPGSAGGCSPHFSDSRIVLRSRRPGGFSRAVCARQPDLDSGNHFRRNGLSPGSSPSGRGGGILPDQLQSGGISV